MHRAHGWHNHCPIVERAAHPYIDPHTAGASPPPLRLLRSLLVGFCPTKLWLRSPLERGHIFCPNTLGPGLYDPIYACDMRMAGMSVSQLLTQSVEIILCLSLRRTRILLPRFLYRDTRTWIVSSSLGPGSNGRAHILLPCSLPHFRFGFGPIIRLHLRMEPLFLPVRQRLRWWANGQNVAVYNAWLAYQLCHC